MRILAGLLLFLSFQSIHAADDRSRLSMSEVMFYRFQDNNFDAIASYLSARDRQQFELDNNDRAFIASVYLNYDIHSQAQDMLNLLIHNESAEIRNTSWFYLGKLHYRNKRIKSAVASFSKIDGALPKPLEDVKHIMYGIMAYNDAKFNIALEEFNKVPESSEFSLYVKYNSSLAQLKLNGDIEKYTTDIMSLISQAADKKYPPIFTDLLYVTSGYQYLNKQQYDNALQQLRQVSANGYYSSRALQGMVYAAYQLGNYDKALNLAVQLLDMTVGNESVHYAYSLIPHILQKLNRQPKAMAFFQYSVEFFDKQRVKLEAYISDIEKGELDPYLLDLKKILTAEEWLQDPEMARLLRYISTLEEWRDAVYKYQEMQHLQKRLDDTFYELLTIDADVKDNKRAQFKNIVSGVSAQKLKVEKSIKWHQYHARYFMMSELKKQHDGVLAYLARARFALAQHYDQQDLETPFDSSDQNRVLISPETNKASVAAPKETATSGKAGGKH